MVQRVGRRLRRLRRVFPIDPPRDQFTALCWLFPPGVVDQDRARRERKPLSRAVARKPLLGGFTVPCEPKALCRLANRGLE
jgi:hypothetical protein